MIYLVSLDADFSSPQALCYKKTAKEALAVARTEAKQRDVYIIVDIVKSEVSSNNQYFVVSPPGKIYIKVSGIRTEIDDLKFSHIFK